MRWALWLTYTLWSVTCDALLFAFHGGQGYRWQSNPMTLAVVLPLLIGWVMHCTTRVSPGPGSDDPVPVGMGISSEEQEALVSAERHSPCIVGKVAYLLAVRAHSG